MLKELWGRPALACREGWWFRATLTTTMVLLLLRGHPALAQDGTEQLFREARAAVQKGDFALSEQKYLEITRQAPQDARAYHDLGLVYLREDKPQEAVGVLEKAVRLNPRLAMSQIVLGRAYYEVHQPSKARASLEEALRLKPSDPEAMLYLSQAQLALGDYEAAASNLEKLAETHPEPAVIQALSAAYMKQTMARLSLQGQFAPRSFDSLMVLALDAETRGDAEKSPEYYQRALEYYRQALEAKPKATGVHYAMGNVLLRLEKLDEATQEFRKEVEVNPGDALAMWKLGALIWPSDPQKAREYLERSVSLSPQRAGPYLAYGRVLAHSGDTEKAIQQYLRAEQLEPQRASTHYLLANAYRQVGRKEDAGTEMARFEELSKKELRRTAESRSKELASEKEHGLLELDPDSASSLPFPGSASPQGSTPRP
jgi:protein O-GlcNAc transferase